MKTYRKILLVLGASALLVGGALFILAEAGAQRFRSLYAAEKAALLQAGASVPARPPDPAALRRLPEPVRRYLAILCAQGDPVFRTVVLRQTGAIRSAPDAAWMPFSSEQSYSISPAGFLWLAQARMAPLLDLWARDKYVDGRGHMLVKMLGLVTVADAKGAAIDRGAALRFLGEIVAFAPGVTAPGVSWRAIDARHAGLAIRWGADSAEGVAEFDTAGRLTSFRATRPMEKDGKAENHAWSGTFSDWKTIDGRLLPAHWEATWHLPDGDFTYVKIDILGVMTE